MTFTATPSSNRFLPAMAGGAVALLIAFVFLVAPVWRLEMLVAQLGLADILSAARPPLGTKARLLLALVAGAGAGAVIWAAAYLLWGQGGLLASRRPATEDEDDYVPAVRRSDRHPDAPPRRPLLAAELGAPPPPPAGEDEEERTLPADLDQPLAAFDPDSMRAVPREPMPIAPMIEPDAEDKGARLPPPDPQNESIESLLDRLERGAARRKARRSN
ncbi:hypothetical protein ACQKJZ_06535 [Sphingomonas sp. NPDC019816]|uniref:hypothetical protein n=1 Tax=Sphingomonas sp. NPDC019816 TaxID=3390679 RepID=UPI003D02FF0F